MLGAILVSLTAMAAIYALLPKFYSRWVERGRREWKFKIDPDNLGDADPHKLTYKELAMPTKNFDPRRGGFGSVYKGFLSTRPSSAWHLIRGGQGEREFLAKKVLIIGKIRHRCHE